MIKENSVQEVMETAKVEDIVRDFVNLRRRGTNFIGLCPFHNEKTPSFNVNPARNIYKCFGCGKGGNAVNFLMEHEQLSFPEALRWIAKKYGIELEETLPSPEALAERQASESLFIVNQYARDFYAEQLLQTDTGRSVGLSYFRDRGFTDETIEKFGLGFAPASGQALKQDAIAKGHSEELLEKLGLVKNDRDFFRDRVMFTIHNLSGKVIAFAGRILSEHKKAPKYINSPETDIYVKNQVLYGAYQARQAIRKEDQCILVEGYTDVLSMHQAGVENVVASSGTSLTIGQIQLIKRYTENILVLYDGDAAGIKAALRGVDLILEQGLNVQVLSLPPGEDPDSYVRKLGAEDFKSYLKDKAQDFVLFKSNLLLQEAENDPIQKSQAIKDVVSTIAKIPDPLKRSLYIKECARLFGVEEHLLIGETNQQVSAKLKKYRFEQQRRQSRVDDMDFPSEEHPAYATDQELPPTPAHQQEKQISGHSFQERDIARIIVTAGHLSYDKEDNYTVAHFIVDNVQDVIDDFDHVGYQKIILLSKARLEAGEPVHPDFFLHHTEDKIRQTAIDLSTSPYEYSEGWESRWDITLQTQKVPEKNFFKDSTEAIQQFRLRKILRMIEKNTEKIKALQQAKDEEQLILHLRLQQRLLAIRKELTDVYGSVILKG